MFYPKIKNHLFNKEVTNMNKFLILSAIFAISAGITNVSKPNTHRENISPLKQQDNTQTVLYSENFDGDALPSEWTNGFDLVDGKAVWNGGGWTSIELDDEKLTDDNNYEISFDLIYTASESVFIHLIGLDATTPGNIYLELIGNGTYWRLANFGAADIYNNSGDDQGCRWSNLPPVLSTTGVNIKFVILDDVVEVWANGERIIVTTMAEFGNRRYSSRRELIKGIFKGIAFDIRGAAGSALIDNFEIKEVEYKATSYVSDERIGGAGGVIPLTIQNLYKDNYHVEADFEVHQTLVQDPNAHGYPRIQILSNFVNGDQLGDPNCNINAQLYLDREFATGWIGAIGNSGSWNGVGSNTYVQSNYENVKFRIAVDSIGDNITFTTSAVIPGSDETHLVDVVNTTYSALDGIDKDDLLQLSVSNHYTDVTRFEYHGFNGDTAAVATVNTNRALVGREVTATAKIFGNATGFEWYLNGEATGVTELVYTSTTLPEGANTLVYSNGTYSSDPIVVDVFSNMITIAGSTTAIYPTEEITFTANAEGEFDGVTLKWYVNDTEISQTGETIALTGLQPGEYKVVCKGGTVTSNEVSFTVLEPKITVSSNKGSYLVDDTASFTATVLGLAEEDTITWYVNDTATTSTGTTFDYVVTGNGGDTVEVKAVSASGVESNVFVVTVAEDILAALEADENWKNIYTQEVTETFGAYEVVESADGNYYHPTNAGGGNDASFPAVNFSSKQFEMTYDLYIPDSVGSYSGEYYVYPQLSGLDSRHTGDWVEVALAVGSSKIRPYIKTHNAGEVYNEDGKSCSTGVDLAYGAGTVDFGWNHISFVFDDKQVAAYVNGTMAMYFTASWITIPSAACMSMYPGSGGEIPLGFKNFAFNAIVLPAPDVESVNVSASKVTATVGETIVFTATVAPYNAEPKSIKWFVNGEAVDCTTLSYSFTAQEAGEYSITCEIDGVMSSAKVVTVTAANANDPAPSTPNNTMIAIAIAAGAAVVLAAGLAIILKKRK